MSDKKFTIEDLSNLLINLMNKNHKEYKDANDKKIESEKEEPKNIIEKEGVSSLKKNKNLKNKKTLNKNKNEKNISQSDYNIINKENKTEKDKYSDEDKEETGNGGILYKYKDDDNKIYYYVFHRKKNNKTDLRCKDRKCLGTAYLDENEVIIIKTKCTIPYENHNYCREIIAYKKLKENEETSENMEEEAYQKMFFKIYIEKFPSIKYEEILNELDIKYPQIKKIIFGKRKYFALKNEIYKEAYDKINKYKLIDNIVFKGEKLLKEKLEYRKENGDKVIIRIFGTTQTLSLLCDKNIKQYYQDGTYKIVPSSLEEIKVVIILLGKNNTINNIELILVACFSEETSDCFIRFYNILKNYSVSLNLAPPLI